ncbi:MAG: methylenetetrahydrofolate dehydrogenase [Clostridiales bacterium]|nr:methylenetetrahydrofolate dehydrogenase [Clostridiales bacterium]
MKARLPRHREFVITMDDKDPRHDECWDKLNAILKEYSKTGESIYSQTFIEDNEDKVKALQEEYGFTYTIKWID